jgi:SagB-type dehydrogenase family enzyme
MFRSHAYVVIAVMAAAMMGAGVLWAAETAAKEPAAVPVKEAAAAAAPAKAETVKLPEPTLKGTVSVEEAIAKRRSMRAWADAPVTMEQVSQLVWAAQGITDKASGHRSAPSAVAIYPLTLYVVMKDGAYKYVPAEHALEKVKDGDLRGDLTGQQQVASAPVAFVIAGDYDKMAKRFAKQAHTFTDFEAGCAAENLVIQAAAMGLGSLTAGGIDAAKTAAVLGCPANETVIIVIPVGKPQ